ncbi:MAG: KamA family radical SAM protein, partial [Nevskiales bacterium]
REGWRTALAQLRSDESIEEVILSGGDPLSLSDAKLSELVALLEDIPHIQRLRIHTRQPIVLPERVDEQLIAWLAAGRLQKIMVLHCNHPQELSAQVVQAIQALKSAGVLLFNQTVLLKKINDNVDVLSRLAKDLFNSGVIPYYLHQLDRVQGAGHFEVPDERALAIHQQLRETLPGYMLSELVREIPGQPSKTPLTK